VSGRPPRPLGALAVLGAILCFSVSSTIVKWADHPGAALAFWRMVGASLVWWIVLLVRRGRSGTPLPDRETWRRVLLPAAFFGANIAVFFTAIGRTSIAHAEFIGSMSPLLLLPAGAIFFREHPDWRALGWGVLSIVGITIVLFGGGSQGTATVGGDLLVVLTLLLWVGYLLSTKWVRRRHIDVVTFMACVMPLALVTTTPIALAVAGDALWPMPWQAWVAVGLLTALTGVAAHGLLVFAQHHLPVATIGVMQVAQPAIAVGWAWLLLGESVLLVQLPGMALVIIGLVAFTMASQRRIASQLVAVDAVDAVTVEETR
jgi:drug/metabolite transporter (DMT)-like permease